MAVQTIEKRRRTTPRQPMFRIESADTLSQRPRHTQAAALGLELDFGLERHAVEGAFDQERDRVERLIAAPRGQWIEARPTAWASRNLVLAFVLSVIVLGFALLPRPTVTGTWSGQRNIVSEFRAVTPTAVITLDASAQSAINGDAQPQP